MSMLIRIGVIAHNTLLEALRQRVLNVLLLFGLVVIGGANFFSEFTFDEQFKFIKDFSLGAMTLIGVIISVVAVAQLLPSEVENRTLFTILSKPVRRWEFLVGKYLGVAVLLFLVVALMGTVFGGVLFVKEKALVAQVQAEAGNSVLSGGTDPAQVDAVLKKIRVEAYDTRLVQAVILIYIKLLLVSAMALFLSTIATSMIFTVIITSLLYIAGHLVEVARNAMAGGEMQMKGVAALLLKVAVFFLPDMGAFSLVDDIVLGHSISWGQTGPVMVYGLLYTAVLLVAACGVFSSKEL